MPKVKVRKSLIGNRYGKLVVLEQLDDWITSSGGKFSRWLTLCDCGKKHPINSKELSSGRVTSCGCYRREIKRTHGLSKHPLYITWSCMLSRTRDMNNPYYGGRGIVMCERWMNSVEDFIKWGIANNFKKGLQIDRIDNNGDYEPSNCRFISSRDNILNQKLPTRANTSGYKGIVFLSRRNKWRSSITIMNKTIYIAECDTKREALNLRNDYIINNNLQNDYAIQKHEEV